MTSRFAVPRLIDVRTGKVLLRFNAQDKGGGGAVATVGVGSNTGSPFARACFTSHDKVCVCRVLCVCMSGCCWLYVLCLVLSCLRVC